MWTCPRGICMAKIAIVFRSVCYPQQCVSEWKVGTSIWCKQFRRVVGRPYGAYHFDWLQTPRHVITAEREGSRRETALPRGDVGRRTQDAIVLFSPIVFSWFHAMNLAAWQRSLQPTQHKTHPFTTQHQAEIIVSVWRCRCMSFGFP